MWRSSRRRTPHDNSRDTNTAGIDKGRASLDFLPCHAQVSHSRQMLQPVHFKLQIPPSGAGEPVCQPPSWRILFFEALDQPVGQESAQGPIECTRAQNNSAATGFLNIFE